MEVINGVIKLAIGLVLVFVMFRVLQKELSQLRPIDFLFLLIVGDLYGGVVQDTQAPIWHLVIIPIWGVIIWIAERITQHEKIQKIVEGEPEIIIQDGLIYKDIMRKHRMNERELRHRLREKGIFNLEEVEIAVLETSGNISAKKRV